MSDLVQRSVDVECAPGVRATGPPVRHFLGLLLLETISWSAFLRLRLHDAETHSVLRVLLLVAALTSYMLACRLALRVHGPPRRHWATILAGGTVLRLAPAAAMGSALWLATLLDLGLILILGHVLVQQHQSPLAAIMYAWHPATLLATTPLLWTNQLALVLLLAAVLWQHTHPRSSRALVVFSGALHPISLGLWACWWKRQSKWAWCAFVTFLGVCWFLHQHWPNTFFSFPFPMLNAVPSLLPGLLAPWLTPVLGPNLYSLLAAATLLSLVMAFRRRSATVAHAALAISGTWLLLLPHLHPQHLLWLLPWLSLRHNLPWWLFSILVTAWLALIR